MGPCLEALSWRLALGPSPRGFASWLCPGVLHRGLTSGLCLGVLPLGFAPGVWPWGPASGSRLGVLPRGLAPGFFLGVFTWVQETRAALCVVRRLCACVCVSRSRGFPQPLAHARSLWLLTHFPPFATPRLGMSDGRAIAPPTAIPVEAADASRMWKTLLTEFEITAMVADG